jgi:uncharacterized protein (DUF1015 family)
MKTLMADVIPFRGVYYNRDRVSGGDVVAPPYDVITPAMREDLYARSPYNIVRIDSGMEMGDDDERRNKYKRAAEYLDVWRREGLLLNGEKSAFYAYRMEYDLEGARKSLTGFFGLVRITELGKGVHAHEATYTKAKVDRMALLECAEANTSPIFALYDKAGRGASRILAEAVSAAEPHLSAVDPEGVTHGFWIIDDEEAVSGIRADLAGSDIFIADGHHRYETALWHREMMRGKADPGAGGDRPYDFVLMFLADIDDEGLAVLPTHRLVGIDVPASMDKLGEYFEVVELTSDAAIIDSIKGRQRCVGLYAGGRGYVLSYRGGGLDDLHPSLRKLDVVVIDGMLLWRLLGVKEISYEMDPERVIERVDSGEFNAGFFLNSTAVEDVREVALSSKRMPPKSTYFYPKVRTGFVMYSLK